MVGYFPNATENMHTNIHTHMHKHTQKMNNGKKGHIIKMFLSRMKWCGIANVRHTHIYAHIYKHVHKHTHTHTHRVVLQSTNGRPTQNTHKKLLTLVKEFIDSPW